MKFRCPDKARRRVLGGSRLAASDGTCTSSLLVVTGTGDTQRCVKPLYREVWTERRLVF